ncbi:Nif3-like dinuclear metal center hexameric protein [Nocardioidaceae bacterium]|nr:Nif3-like dinuclear metal center hexameric protein [Nocardioidaceae bacterium]
MQLRDVLRQIESWYPPATAHSWDKVGLTVGDPTADVRTVLLAVDPAPAVVDEALAMDADLVVTHHPLLLRGVNSVAATGPKGRTVHRLIQGGCALYTAHTNADVAPGGVNEAMAQALGLTDTTLLDVDDPAPGDRPDKLVVLVPVPDAERVREAMADAGAGSIGEYDRASFSSTGQGRFRPSAEADPHIGRAGVTETVEEVRIEVLVRRRDRTAVIAALLGAHPYEEVAYDLYELVQLPWRADRGIGRVGELRTPLTLRDFTAHVAAALPATQRGVAAGGDPDRMIRTVALCSGAGDSLLDVARRTGADAYVTSDLRHHVASEFLEHPGAPALLDVSHWAAEWTWLPVLADRLTARLGDLDVRVSTVVTDPWTVHAASPSHPAARPHQEHS